MTVMRSFVVPLLFPLLFLSFLALFAFSAPINRSFPLPVAPSVHPFSSPPFGQPMQMLSSAEENAVHPPHCSKAIVTVAQSSRLTKRGASAHPPNSSLNGGASRAAQLTMNIAVGQSVCFKMQRDDQSEAKSEEKMEEKSSTIGSKAKNSSKNGTFEEREEASEGTKVLHSVTVVDLEQYHAITERYRFAIPEVETRCICECESDSANCAADRYKYGKCDERGEEDELGGGEGQQRVENSQWQQQQQLRRDSSSLRQRFPSPAAVCHRTFFSNQPTGQHCSGKEVASSTARLCCQLRFRPFQNRHFTALRLENAVTSALIQYSQWKWRGNGKGRRNEKGAENGTESDGQTTDWEETERRRVRIQLDGTTHSTILDEELGLKLSMLGLNGAKSAGAQLDPGVYFVENHSDGSLGEITGQIAVNRITEHDFHKLGWFRLDEKGRPFVQYGEVFLDKIHHARADDCAEQRFRSVLDASYYVNGDNNETSQFRLADPLNSVHKWIRSARVFDAYQRIALVRAREGVSLEVTMATKPRSDESEDGQPPGQSPIVFVHNSSQLGDFFALMLIDRFSNSLLNITLFNASGVLNGFVRRLSDPEGSEIDGFSINVPAEHSADEPKGILLRIKPYPLGSIHIVCLRPDDAELSRELCRPVQTVYHELEVNTVRNEWSEAIGNCPKCNKINAEGFAKYLNPANWVRGISSASDALMLASDIFGYLFVLLVFYFLIIKIGIPLINCCCMNSPSCCFSCPSVGKVQKK
ncbi:hypothetical protein niasHS_003374 [Heterodera schachtii]|uniref:Transmembrane protein n=1 Tax=Heterodera schachtii TaxID=97005 RepID=A0ABD2KH24_HETSC